MEYILLLYILYSYVTKSKVICQGQMEKYGFEPRKYNFKAYSPDL